MPETNISLFLLAFLPALVYALMIWFSYPKKTINPKIAFLHFLMGTISVLIVQTWNWIFPEWSQMYYQIESFPLAMLTKAFVQVALLEEASKLVTYKFTEMYRKKIAMPLSTMFYSMCISAGFAVVENMTYISGYGFETGIRRATTAIVIHMVLGLMLGYFISLGTRYKSKWRYRLLGLLFVTSYHALYDFNIFISYVVDPFGRMFSTGLGINSYWIVSSGLFMVLTMFMHIRWLKYKKLPFTSLWNKLRKKN